MEQVHYSMWHGVVVLVALAPVGVLVAYGCFRWMVSRVSQHFDVLDELRAGNLAVGVFLGLVAVAVAHLVGVLFSRFI